MIHLECRCGKRILISKDFPSDRGRCPRCGDTVDLTQLGIETPRPVSNDSTDSKSATGVSAALFTACLLAIGLSVVGLVLAFRARAETRFLAREIESGPNRSGPDFPVGSTARASRTQPVSKASDFESLRAIETLRKQMKTLDDRVEKIQTLAEKAASRSVTPVRTVSTPSPSGSDLQTRLLEVARRCSPPVVAIVTDRGAGSGVVFSSDGLIVTNEHVISGRRVIEVHFPSGAKYEARVLGRDVMSDIALLQVKASNLTVMPIGDSDQVKVGQVVAALGNPFGLSRDGKPTMTVGIVSALHRIVTPGNGQRRYGDAIQTDAAINPGNSGGALVDLDGKLIGINGAISSSTGTSAGVGFAIPVNFVQRILPTLKQGKSPQPGFLGITVRDMNAKESSRTRHRGAVVATIQRGSPAHRARLRSGQLITRFEGKSVTSSTDLINRISYYQAGSLVRIRIVQLDGVERDVTVRIGEIR